MPGVKLHVLPMSVSCLPCVALCEEGGIQYESKMVDLMNGAHKAPEYLAMNPMHCVPAMDDDGFTMWEGRAIARYLAAKFGLESFYPSDPKKRAYCDLALDFHCGVWYEKITKGILYPPCGWAPAPSAEELAAIEKALHEDYWPALQKMIAFSGGKMLGGDSPNLADIFFCVHLEYTKMCCPSSCIGKHAALMDYSAAVKAKLPKWSNWSGPADQWFTSKKV